MIVQTAVTGEVNIILTQEWDADQADFLVNWPGSKVRDCRVFIVTEDADVEQLLLTTEFRSVDNCTDIAPPHLIASEEAVARLQEFVKP